MNEWIIIGMFVLLVVVVVALVIVVRGYRRDAAEAAVSRTEQNKFWNTAQTAVLDYLTEQQQANIYLEKLNDDLTKKIAAIQTELAEVRRQLEVMSQRLEAMTARAEAAEDKAID